MTLHGYAQILNPPAGREFAHHQKFNHAFIAANGIREIRCTIESKRDGEKIRNTKRSIVYHFDNEGNTKLISEIDQRLGDTAMVVYTYAGSRLHCEVKNDAAGMFSYCYAYQPDGLPEARNYGRAERLKTLYSSPPPAHLSTVSTEKYQHARYENQLHSTLNNSSGRPYLKQIRYYDEHGYLMRFLQTYVMSSEKVDESYAYNKLGFLSEKHIHTTQSVKFEYGYDEVGNLISEHKYEGDALLYRKEFVYEGKNMLLRAELQRDDAAGVIVITNYTYK